MKPEYIERLADLADPGELWRLGGLDQLHLPDSQRVQLDAGVALRRHASLVKELDALRGTGRSLLITPLGLAGRHITTVPTPTPFLNLLDPPPEPEAAPPMPSPSTLALEQARIRRETQRGLRASTCALGALGVVVLLVVAALSGCASGPSPAYAPEAGELPVRVAFACTPVRATPGWVAGVAPAAAARIAELEAERDGCRAAILEAWGVERPGRAPGFGAWGLGARP